MTTAPEPPDDVATLFERVAARFLDDPRVERGTGFGGTPGLRVNKKIFAMLGRGELVVKLPRGRVDELVAAGMAKRFDPRGDGRLMKEWATISSEHDEVWASLADEAIRFVGG